MGIHGLLHSFGNLVGGALPYLNQTLVLFLLGEQTAAIVTLSRLGLLQCGTYDLTLFRRYRDVRYCDGISRASSVGETDVFDSVSDHRGSFLADDLIQIGYQILQITFIQNPINKLNTFGQDAVEDHAAHRRIDQTLLGLGKPRALIIIPGLGPQADIGMDLNQV